MEKTDEEAGYSTIDEVAQQEPDKTVSFPLKLC